MIVKLQISQAGSDPQKHVLIYNKDRTVYYEDVASKEIIELMGDEPKLFFEAEIKNKQVEIIKQAPWQNW